MLTKKIAFTLLFIISIPSLLNASPLNNNTLSGTVYDNEHHTLPGAIIQIPDVKAGGVTDSNGKYLIENLPKGKYLVVVTMISYTTFTQSVMINGDTKKDFTMNESAIENKEVVITGQSKATEIRRSPVPIVAINNDYLKENISSNIIDAIAKVPGVTAVSTGPNISKPYIRGLGYNRVLTLYDGMRQEGQQWGDEHGIEVDEYGIDRVEVIKGPSSLIYGSDALAGVVNLIPTPVAPAGKIIGSVETEYQSNNNMIGASGMASGNKNGFIWLGRISHKQAMDYQNPVDGRVYATNFSETDANAIIGINKGWGFSHLDLSLFDDLQAIPDGSRDSASRQFTKQITEADTFRPVVSNSDLHSYSLPTLHQHVQHYRAMLSNNINLAGGTLALNIGFERSVRREFSHPENADIAGLYLQMNSYTYDLKYYAAEFKGWNITGGINGMYQTNDATAGTEFIIPSYLEFDFGPFIMAKKSYNKLDLSGGIRYDVRSFHNDALTIKLNPVTGFDMAYTGSDTSGTSKPFSNYDHTFSGMTYSIGATYNFTEHLSVKANIARGFRAPNIAEISANGVHPGTNIYQVGNSNFSPEFSLQEDLGLDYVSKHISISAAVFNNSISNYIYNQKVLAKSGQDSIIVPGAQTFQFQQATVQLYGGELSIDIHPHPLDWLHFENGISVVYGVNSGAKNDSSKYLPFIPPLHGTSELRANFKQPLHYLKNAFIKLQMVYYTTQDKVYLAYNTETRTSGYTLFNFAMGTDITSKKGKSLCNISLFADNIFDLAYQDHLSRLKYFEPYPGDPRGRSGIYNMGRNIGVKIFVPLQF